MSHVLPRLVVLTDRTQCASRGRTLIDTVRRAAEGGARAVLLREKDLAYDERGSLAEEILAVMGPVGGRVGIASDAGLAVALGLDWVHLAQRDPPITGATHALVGRSCHDAREAIEARAEGCGYVTMSPVALTSSKPGYGPALGIRGLLDACNACRPIPVWALAGITPANAGDWLGAGAAGIAVMGAVMAAADPAAATASFLDALNVAR